MSTNPKRPAVVLFDVIERLFDIQPLEEKLMAARFARPLTSSVVRTRVA
jgi:hypothetical protein